MGNGVQLEKPAARAGIATPKADRFHRVGLANVPSECLSEDRCTLWDSTTRFDTMAAKSGAQ
jgi:hypothetical protein